MTHPIKYYRDRTGRKKKGRLKYEITLCTRQKAMLQNMPLLPTYFY